MQAAANNDQSRIQGSGRGCENSQGTPLYEILDPPQGRRGGGGGGGRDQCIQYNGYVFMCSGKDQYNGYVFSEL